MMVAKRMTQSIKTQDNRIDFLRRMKMTVPLILFLLVVAVGAAGQDNASVLPSQLRGVGIDQRLNNQVPMDLKFRDEAGQTVTLGSYFGKKPVILSLVYYTCPMLCTMAENGLLNALRDVNFNIGEQFEVVTVSIDPTETPEMAMGKKAVYVGLYGRPGAKQGWHFLVGDEPSIRTLTQSSGISLQLYSGNQAVRTRHRNRRADAPGKSFALLLRDSVSLARYPPGAGGGLQREDRKSRRRRSALLLPVRSDDGQVQRGYFADPADRRGDYPAFHGDVDFCAIARRAAESDSRFKIQYSRLRVSES